MTDWRQIPKPASARPKEQPGRDMVKASSELFQRTRDGMVAWELRHD